MRIITLLTDWQNDDYYKAVAKASILSKVSDTQFVDISHQAQHYHISKAAFILESSVRQFPKGTIHIFGIQTVDSDNPKVIVGRFNEQYIVASNNGIFDLLNIEFDELVSVDAKISNFPIAENFAPIVVKIIEGNKLSNIGTVIDKTVKYNIVEPTIEDDKITCPVSYIDSYGNLILNIQKVDFEKERKGRDFVILINSFKYKADKISEHYNQVPKSEIFAIFNSAGWLELGMRMANISQILNLSDKSSVIIKFL
jgi:S-adenosylmethionine hydrolase